MLLSCAKAMRWPDNMSVMIMPNGHLAGETGLLASGEHCYEPSYKVILNPSRTLLAFLPLIGRSQRRQPLSLLHASFHNGAVRHYSVLNDPICGWMATQTPGLFLLEYHRSVEARTLQIPTVNSQYSEVLSFRDRKSQKRFEKLHQSL